MERNAEEGEGGWREAHRVDKTAVEVAREIVGRLRPLRLPFLQPLVQYLPEQ